MSKRHTIKLSALDASYLKRDGVLDAPAREALIHSMKDEPRGVVLYITVESAEIIREALTERLAIVGFDEDYSVNSEGRTIENLIDELYLHDADWHG